MAADEPITFPDEPRAELDRTLTQLVEQASKVMETQGRLRALIDANRAVVSHLELPTVLRTIVEAAVSLVGARYGALGVIAEGGGLEQFIHVGMGEDDVERIGHLPEGHGLLGALIDDPRPIRIESIASDPRSAGFPDGHPPMGAFLGVPIVVRDAVYGNLYLTDPAAGSFSADDEQLVRALADNAGFAIDNARLFAETVVRQAWSASAAEMTAAILGGDSADAFDEVVVRVAGLVGADAACVLITDIENGTVRVAASTEAQAVAPAEWPLTNDQVRSAAEGAQTTRAEDIGPLGPLTGWESGPVLIVPFDGDAQQTRPVLCAWRRPGSRLFTAFELERTVAFSRQAALAIELAAARADRQQVLLLEDRARIARDLHDHVIQQLFGTGMELQSIEATVGPGLVSDRIDVSVKALDEAIAQIRTIIFALSRPRANGGGLRHRLLDIVQGVGGTLPDPATLAFSGPIDLVVDSELADDVAAFVREGLTNVVRHSGARTAAVAVTADAQTIDVSVADDGHGIGAASRRSGLANIEERARRRDGSLTIESGPSGTRLLLSLPIPPEEPQ